MIEIFIINNSVFRYGKSRILKKRLSGNHVISMYVATQDRNDVIYPPMQNKNTISRQLILLATVFLTACTVNPQIDDFSRPIQAMDRQTDDLANVKADALDLAEQAGKEHVL